MTTPREELMAEFRHLGVELRNAWRLAFSFDEDFRRAQIQRLRDRRELLRREIHRTRPKRGGGAYHGA